MEQYIYFHYDIDRVYVNFLRKFLKTHDKNMRMIIHINSKEIKKNEMYNFLWGFDSPFFEKNYINFKIFSIDYEDNDYGKKVKSFYLIDEI